MKRIKFGAPFIAGIMAFGAYSSALAHEGHDDSKASGAVATITEEDIEYLPEEQTVHVGQLIRVENKDPFEHKSRVTLQHEGGGLGHIALKDHIEKSGTSFTFKLDKPGTYEIRCLLHDGMTATIKVVE
ncbi:MAG: plastocyanin/azurin family copper-binding protein [Mariprofundaceae bacterium]|nr:plastocyanin/azurin family copper-binding protein [Mariprofundaceae bacterium]